MKLDLNSQFQAAISLMEKTHSCLFITGKAGTGKSTLLEYFCAHTRKKSVVLAPTGVAALNVQGQTIHRFFNFYPDVTPKRIESKEIKPRQSEIYKKIETIIIDEVSMLRADLLDCIDVFLRMYGPHKNSLFGGVQMVFIGDLYQLPPVVLREERAIFDSYYETPYFFSSKALGIIDLTVIELETVYRQKDKKFVNLLNKIRNNSIEQSDINLLNQRHLVNKNTTLNSEYFISLATTNARADEINERHLNALDGKLYKRKASIKGDFGKEYFPTAIDLQFKVGSQIMLLNNDHLNRWVNGSIGVIENLEKRVDGDEEHIIVRLQDNEQLVTVTRFMWEVNKITVDDGSIVSLPAGSFEQFPFRLAWAVTIHKSQGKTFNRVVIDIGQGTFASGQIYVALSRCTSFKGVFLRLPVEKHHIRVDTRIHNFLTSQAYKKAEEKLPLSNKIILIEQAINSGQQLRMVYLKANASKFNLIVTPIKLSKRPNVSQEVVDMLAYSAEHGKRHLFDLLCILDLEIV
ncbi:MAG: AAA family ATPase [Aestuariivita sp.]|nr:AAA family ATPase [Aestuariivita sp.]